MKQGRMNATATLLPNGKVLVAGGDSHLGLTVSILASAELYDPSTGKFTSTGSMATARSSHTATLLRDGRVLLTGGAGCAATKACSPGNAPTSSVGSLASAELYDPTTGKFSSAGSMFTARTGGTATLLPDGRVLLASGGGHQETAELYDPKSGKFVRTGKVPSFDNDATATLLPDGKVLLTGTTGSGPGANLYVAATGKFTLISFALQPSAVASAQYNGQAVVRTAPDTATPLKDGRVLLNESGYLETYSPATGEFTPAGFVSQPGQWFGSTATLLADGRVLFEGGTLLTDPAKYTYVEAGSAALYDPSNTPHATGSMHTARDGQTATLLPNGSVLIAGGSDDAGNALASAELLKP
jgi:hypothetical protein